MCAKFIDKIYKSNSNSNSLDLYDKWAASYDKELKENQYVTPVRCAQILSEYFNNKKIKILDIGCGTGLSGDSLKKLGFKRIDGLDLSEKMLKIAVEKKIYQSIFNLDLNNLHDFKKKYDAIIAVGVISPAHAEADTIINSYSLLNTNGIMIFSINDHALNDAHFFQAINKSIKQSRFILLDQIYGDHIKGLKLNSSIFILKKTE